MEVAQFVIIIAVIILSVILHEFAHGAVAYWLGDRTAKEAGRLSLNPIKHIDPFMSILVPVILYLMRAPVFGGAKPVPINPHNLKGKEWGMALVALAGPLTNFLLALIFFLIGYAIFGQAMLQRKIILDTGHFFFQVMTEANIGFMLFNLIPIPPLDGSRVLYAISPDSVRNFLMAMEPYGIIFVCTLIMVFGTTFSGAMAAGRDGVLSFFYWVVGR